MAIVKDEKTTIDVVEWPCSGSGHWWVLRNSGTQEKPSYYPLSGDLKTKERAEIFKSNLELDRILA